MSAGAVRAHGTAPVLRGNGDVMRFVMAHWPSLVQGNPHLTVFQTAEWYCAWISAVAARESAEPILVRVPPSGPPLAALPLQVSAHAGATRIVQPLSAPWADYHESVGAAADPALRDALGEALAAFLQEEKADAVFDDVLPDGMLARILERAGGVRTPSSTTHALDLTDAAAIERLLASAEYAMKWRRLNRLGDVDCTHHTDPGAIAARMPDFAGLHRREWQERGNAVAPFGEGAVDAGFQALVRWLAPKGMLMLTELTLDGRPIAMYFGFLFRGCYFAYRTAYDRTHWRLSPGHLMLRRMIADFRQAGVRRFDLMRGAYAYKQRYSTHAGRNLRVAIAAGVR